MRRTKVIHIYLIFEKRNYYFSSVTGIFRHLSEDQIKYIISQYGEYYRHW